MRQAQKVAHRRHAGSLDSNAFGEMTEPQRDEKEK